MIKQASIDTMLGESYMFPDNTLYGSYTICPAVGDHRGCPYFFLPPRTGLRFMDSFQKGGFSTQHEEEGVSIWSFLRVN